VNTIIIRHGVNDFDNWKAAYDDDAAAREAHGLTQLGVHRDVADPNVVTVALRASDLANAEVFLASDDLRETMQSAGVISQPDVWITTDV
jgi:hypothetical protein